MFVDRAKIYVIAGSGGKGCNSFTWRKAWRYRRPDGGNGGKGGDIVIRADRNVQTLLDFQYRRHFKAESGGHGGGNLKKGRNALNTVILVPPGTIISNSDTGLLICDLEKETEEVIVASGGSGGKGNHTKKEATPGEAGEELSLSLELKILADIGLVGYPNAGKSSLLNAVSHAKSKVADFPFTTLSPVLGVIQTPYSSQQITVADIPGLIKDAHKGKGLGIEFLRHIERTKLLVFVIDMAGADGRIPAEDYFDLIREIGFYKAQLLRKPQVIVANKMDMPQAKANLKFFKKEINKKVYPISCKTSIGIEKLTICLHKALLEKTKTKKKKENDD